MPVISSAPVLTAQNLILNMTHITRNHPLACLLVCLLYQIIPVSAGCDGDCVKIAVGCVVGCVVVIGVAIVVAVYCCSKKKDHDLNHSRHNVGQPGMVPHGKDIEAGEGYDNTGYNMKGEYVSYLTPVLSVPGYVACREYKNEEP